MIEIYQPYIKGFFVNYPFVFVTCTSLNNKLFPSHLQPLNDRTFDTLAIWSGRKPQ